MKNSETNRQKLIQALQQRGYKATPVTVTKNGNVKLNGISVSPLDCKLPDNLPADAPEFCPTIYMDYLLPEVKTIEEAADRVVSIVTENVPSRESISLLFDHDYFFSHIYVALEKHADVPGMRLPSTLEGLDVYIYLSHSLSPDQNAVGAVRLTDDFLSLLGFEEDLKLPDFQNMIWNTAWQNTTQSACIYPFEYFLSQTSPFSEPNMEEYHTEYGQFFFVEPKSTVYSEQISIYLATNHMKLRGASTVLIHPLLQELAYKFSAYTPYPVDRFLVIPSSINECLLIPFQQGQEIPKAHYDQMLQHINITEVDPQERLYDETFIIEV